MIRIIFRIFLIYLRRQITKKSMKNKFSTLLIIFVLCAQICMFANNARRPVPVSNSSSLSTNPGSERVPPRDSCPFELYYCEDTNTLEIYFADEVDYTSYCLKNQEGLILDFVQLGSFTDGMSYYLPLSFFSSDQYTIELNCNYGSFWAVF